ncbi:MAG: DUF1800 domain-containing protein [Chloroflexi bacterium]|nr:MAG: DUF1800 domain-containing protein [Chloroflexota bacterium]
MGAQGKKTAPAGPTRRKVLVTALATAAGVAGARILGLRNLDSTESLTSAMDAADMSMATGMAEPADEYDAMIGVPDDSYVGPQDLDPSYLPPSQPATLPPVDVRPAVMLQPPISGIAAPKLAGDVDWISPLAKESAKVTHLLRRATFGATDTELDRALSEGFARTVERLIETPFVEPPVFPAPAAPRPSASPSLSPRASASARPSASATARPSSLAAATSAPTHMPAASAMATARPSATAAPSMGAAAASASPTVPAVMTNATSINIGNLQGWWLDWMTKSPTPFAERMTLFWHGHFTSDYRKVGTNSPAIYWQNLTWRRMALGDLRSMLLKVTPDLAMLRYLDLAASTGRAPNENYARELLELFTMGVGSYTEDDVKAAAKALAGWRLPMRTEPTAQTGIFDPRRAFAAPVTFLGKTGTFNTESVVDTILANDATAPFMVRQFLTSFVTPSPSDAYVARLADRFRRSRYDTKTLMRDIFTSPEFVAPEMFRALIKSPTDFMVSAAKALGATNLSGTIRQYGSTLGQNMFDPPSVAGWGEGASWISSNTMLQRANFVTAALGTLRTTPSAARAHERHLDSVLAQGTVNELNVARDDKSRWFAVFASPEFQLK